MARKASKDLDEVRNSFPEVCKWYTPEAKGVGGPEQVEAEVLARSRRFEEQGISPCHECPLCQGEHGH